jgi:3,4-dihydroxy 2-butanone 4-phosphate synthase/GTP cyclohydrolase II
MSTLSPIEDAVAALADGQMVVVVDSPDRENEGDLIVAAEKATPAIVNFMATHGRGLVCVAAERERLAQLGIPPMTATNTDPKGTAFHVGVDYAHHTSTGISASDRAATIRAIADPESRGADFTQPGHVFPLAARPGGVLSRAGHTEASVDLAVLAGLAPAAAICEIAAADGEMERLPGLLRFAQAHGLHIIAISDLIAYRQRYDHPVVRAGSARMPIDGVDFQVVGFSDRTNGLEHVALVLGDVRGADDVLVRVHSECLTGDVFGSARCDCGPQLRKAIATIAEEGRGVVVYLRGHEGRGIGLVNKIHAYRLQDEGLDTVDANLRLGQPADRRDYGVGVQILRDLGAHRVRLLTNNPDKRAGLELYGLEIVGRVPLITTPTPENRFYLHTKRTRLGHELAA